MFIHTYAHTHARTHIAHVFPSRPQLREPCSHFFFPSLSVCLFVLTLAVEAAVRAGEPRSVGGIAFKKAWLLLLLESEEEVVLGATSASSFITGVR